MKYTLFIVLVICALVITFGDKIRPAYDLVRGQVGSNDIQITYDFGVVNIPTERSGLASSSTGPGGYEFGVLLPTNTTAFTIATTSTGFAITMNGYGRIKGCTFNLQTIPTTGTVSTMIQKNGTLQTGKYCKLPRSGTFANNGGTDDVSVLQNIADDLTFVPGDRFGLIASSSNLNAATFDGSAQLIVEFN